MLCDKSHYEKLLKKPCRIFLFEVISELRKRFHHAYNVYEMLCDKSHYEKLLKKQCRIFFEVISGLHKRFHRVYNVYEIRNREQVFHNGHVTRVDDIIQR